MESVLYISVYGMVVVSFSHFSVWDGRGFIFTFQCMGWSWFHYGDCISHFSVWDGRGFIMEIVFHISVYGMVVVSLWRLYFTFQCMGWSWFLANDMQFYAVSIVLLFVLTL